MQLPIAAQVKAGAAVAVVDGGDGGNVVGVIAFGVVVVVVDTDAVDGLGVPTQSDT